MINVLVVDDSAFSRKTITKILENIPDVRVVDIAVDGRDAIKKTLRLQPDLITLDLEMPHMDGFTFLRWVMNTAPTPVIVVSAQEADDNVFKAMDLGAVDFVIKPTRHASLQLEEIKADLLEKVLATPLLKMRKIEERMIRESENKRETLARVAPEDRPHLIGIASSTGGPPAIQQILSELPSGFDVPILVAQHMPPSFTALFAERLNKYTTLKVTEARDESAIHPGCCYIAPGGKHLLVEKRGSGFVTLVRDRHLDRRYSPSANLLFRSIAQSSQSHTIGAVLTGMGDDGRDGLKEIKAQGGITIAESERTAIIFGMPQEAIKTGCVDYVLPLHEISSHITSLCRFES